MKLLPSDPDIQTIVARINSGDLDLQPNFQRGEVWTEAKKKKLIDSILRDWHIPPIHVVVTANGKQEVLDGQQRLVSIRDFVNGEFNVDGRTEPTDESILKLHDHSYSDLPSEVRRAFDQFTIRVFRLVDYRPGEPGELFFRLNQMTYLTAAEQRNAFFGPVREQVQELVYLIESSKAQTAFGFSNRRMAYNDVLARVLCTLETGTLGIKLGANEISSRFRSPEPFPQSQVRLTAQTIEFLSTALLNSDFPVRFNKATLFTWLTFATFFVRAQRPPKAISDFIWMFDAQRARSSQSLAEFKQTKITDLPHSTERALLRIFTDRSSSRVSDVSSVVFRDVILWLFFFDHSKSLRNLLPPKKQEILKAAYFRFAEARHSPEQILEETVEPSQWGELA